MSNCQWSVVLLGAPFQNADLQRLFPSAHSLCYRFDRYHGEDLFLIGKSVRQVALGGLRHQFLWHFHRRLRVSSRRYRNKKQLEATKRKLARARGFTHQRVKGAMIQRCLF